MGFGERFTNILNATGSAMQTPFGLAFDMAKAPFTGDQEKSVLERMSSASSRRLDELQNETVRRGGAVEQAVGALPEGAVRKPVKSAFNWTNRQLDRLYNNTVSRPLSSLGMAYTLSSQEGYQFDENGKLIDTNYGKQARALFKAQTWQDAWEIGDEYSPGQSFALANAYAASPISAATLTTTAAGVGEIKDINDVAGLQKFMGSDYYKYMSGSMDAVSRVFIDPTVVGGKIGLGLKGVKYVAGAEAIEDAATGAIKIEKTGSRALVTEKVGQTRTGIIEGATQKAVTSVGNRVLGNKPLSHQDQIRAQVDSSSFLKANIDMEGKSGAYIAQRYFANETDGGLIGDLYEQAGTIENRKNLTRFMMGDKAAWDDLASESTALTNQLDRLYGEGAFVKDKFKFYNATTQQDKVAKEIDELYPNTQSAKRQSTVWGAINQAPEKTIAGGLRTNITRSDFYQRSPLSKPLRVIHTKAPTGILSLNDERSYTQVQRQLIKSDLKQADQDAWLAQYAQAGTPEARQAVYEQLEHAALRSMFKRDRDTLKGEIADDPSGKKVLTDWVEDKNGNLFQTFKFEDGKTARPKERVQNELTEDEIEEILRSGGYYEGRRSASDMLQNRAYDGDPNRSMVKVADDDAAEQVHVSLWETQNARLIPMIDLDEVRKADRYRPKFGDKQIRSAGRMGNEVLNGYNKAWKAATLIRVGYPIRVQADQQMRAFAKLGALTQIDNLIKIGEQPLQAIRASVKNSFHNGELGINSVVRVNGAGTGKVIGNFKNGRVSVRMKNGDILNDVSVDDVRYARLRDFGIGQDQIRSGNNIFNGAFTTMRDEQNISKTLISSEASNKAFLNDNEKDFFGRALNPEEMNDIELPSGTKFLGSYKTLTYSDNQLEYKVAYEHALNNVIGQSVLGKKLLSGEDPEDVKRWLVTTKEGKELRSRMSHLRSGDPSKWVDTAHESIESLTLGNPALKQLAADGRLKLNDLERLGLDAAAFPRVNGQQLVQNGFQASYFLDKMNGFVNGAMKWLGTMPDDILARQPVYKSLYTDEIHRLASLVDDGEPIGDDLIQQITNRARTKAVGEVQDLMYDMANQTDLARMLRFVSPFFMAWQDSLTRWTANIIESPDTIAQIRNIWLAPDRAGLVRDEKGNIIKSDGTAEDPVTGEKVPQGKERYVVFMKPDWMKVPGVSDGSQIAFNKKTFGLLMSGSPGVGPLAAVPLNEYVKRAPQHQDLFKWALPYGAQATGDLLSPSVLRRVDDAMNEDAGTTYQTALRIYQEKLTDYRMNLGGPDEMPEPTFEEALGQAQTLSYVKVINGLVLPFVPTFRSPYQPQLDAYRRAQEKTRLDPYAFGATPDGDPIGADVWFLDNYGEELFYLTQGMTKSYDGIPPTTDGFMARKEHQDLVEQYPNLGGFIAGQDGAGTLSKSGATAKGSEFNSSVYRTQTLTDVAPGSEHKQREQLTAEQWEQGAQSSQGWREYTQMMDMIDAELADRNLTSLNVKAAADIKEVKDNMVADLASRYPGWFDDYNQSDRQAFKKKLDGFRAITQDEGLMKRDEVQGVASYLEMRDVVVAELQNRKAAGGSANVENPSNRDIQIMWDGFTNELVDTNLSFAQTYHRYLDNDKLD